MKAIVVSLELVTRNTDLGTGGDSVVDLGTGGGGGSVVDGVGVCW